MSRHKIANILFACVIFCSGSLFADVILVDESFFVGSRSYTNGITGLDANGDWEDTDTILSWTITKNDSTGLYTYTYTFSHDPGATSHFILQISDGKVLDDFTFLQIGGGNLEKLEIDIYSGDDNSNPGMPGEFYGIKFDETTGTTTTIQFTTLLDPIWGSFYAKDGRANNGEMSAAWNIGLATSNRPSLTDNFLNWIPTPDGETVPPPPQIPEPSTLLLLGSGVIALGIWGRRKLRK